MVPLSLLELRKFANSWVNLIRKVYSCCISRVKCNDKFDMFLGKRWTGALKTIISDCLSNQKSTQTVSKCAVNLYGDLSNEIHGSPWDLNAIQISDQLDALDKCILEKICREMGIL